jgi:hypothetical protein
MKTTKAKAIVSIAAAAGIACVSVFSVMALDTNGVIDLNADLELEKPVSKVSLDQKKIVKRSGGQLKLNAKTNGKASSVVYYSTDSKVAKVSANGTVRFGKRGKAKIIAQCNGAKTFCDVTVKKPLSRQTVSGTVAHYSLNASTMRKAEEKIGCQIQHAYPSSTVMCSAYSFAYAYYQVTGDLKPAGYFWSSGGCTWRGGTYHRYSSPGEMLSAIKKQLDNGRACVGYLRTGSSPRHYVTFYGYTGSGKNLSDYKILDPWDGKITTAAGYGYSCVGYHVATVN